MSGHKPRNRVDAARRAKRHAKNRCPQCNASVGRMPATEGTYLVCKNGHFCGTVGSKTGAEP